MKTIEEQIKVMQHFANGGEVEEFALKCKGLWNFTNNPSWNWEKYDYRIKDKPAHRDPNTFEVGDLVENENGVTFVVTDTDKHLAHTLVEFDDPILGRLRVLQDGEPLEMCGQKAYHWVGGNISRYYTTNAESDEFQTSDLPQYYMPVETYRKWKAEQRKPKTRPMTFEELIPLVGTPVKIEDGGDYVYYQPLGLYTGSREKQYYLVGVDYEEDFSIFHEHVTRLDGSKFEVEVE